MRLAATFLLMLLPGLLLAFALLGRRRGLLLDLLAFGPLLGALLAAVLDLATRQLLDRAATRSDLALLAAAAALAGLPAWRRRSAPGPESGPSSVIGAAAQLAFLASLGFAATVFVLRTIAFPDGGWDGQAVWGLLGRTLAATAGDPRTALATITLTQTDYPQLLPGCLGLLQREAGLESSLPGQLMAALGFAGLVLGIDRVLDRLAGRTAARLGALLVLVTPTFLLRASDQYADVLLAAIDVAAAGLFACVLRSRRPARGLLLLAGLHLGALTFTKLEGLFLASVLFLAAVAATGPGLRARLDRAGLLVLGALPGLGASLWFLLGVAPADRRLGASAAGFLERAGDLERWSAALAGLGREFGLATVSPGGPAAFDPVFQRWGLLFAALAIIALVTALRFDRARFFLLLAALGQFAVQVALLALIADRQDWQIDNAAHRLLLQVAPLFVLLALAGCRRRSGEPEVEGEAGVDDAEAAALVEGEGGGVS